MLCTEIQPAIFAAAADGLAYVKESEWPDLAGPGGTNEPTLRGTSGRATVPLALQDSVREACAECPGECIFIEEDE
jgi:ferredoxin